MTDFRALCAELIEAAEDMTVLNDDSDARFDAVAERARTALAEPEPAPPAEKSRQPHGYAYRYQRMGSSVVYFNGGGEVNGSKPVEAIPYWLGHPPQPAPPAVGAEALIVRSMMEQVAAMGDCIGQQTVGQIMVLSQRAAAWLRENPPGQPVAVEPAPPTAGEVAKLAAKLRRLAAQNSLGTADPTITRAAELLERQQPQPVPMSERPWEREGWCDDQGRCWWGRAADEFCNHDWHYATRAEVEDFCSDAMPQVALPAQALPLPTPQSATEDSSATQLSRNP